MFDCDQDSYNCSVAVIVMNKPTSLHRLYKKAKTSLNFMLLRLSITRGLKIQSSTDKYVFRYRQSNVRRILPASDHCRARGNQIVLHISDNETVLGSSRKLGGAAQHLIDGSEKLICRLSFEF